jgi:hypothetical protein
MKSKFTKPIDVKYNSKAVVETRYKRKRGYTRKQIKQEVKRINKRLRKKGVEGRIMISSQFRYGWRSGRMSRIGNQFRPDIYDKSDYYEIYGNPVNTDDNINAFSIFVLAERLRGGSDKNNDCLFKCLLQAFNGYE